MANALGLPDLTFFRLCRWRVIGSFEFFRVRFGCAIVKNIDIETCGIATWINAFTWPCSSEKPSILLQDSQ